MDSIIKAISSRPVEEITRVARPDNRTKKRKKSREQPPEDVLILHGENKEKHVIATKHETESESAPGHEVDIVVH